MPSCTARYRITWPLSAQFADAVTASQCALRVQNLVEATPVVQTRARDPAEVHASPVVEALSWTSKAGAGTRAPAAAHRVTATPWPQRPSSLRASPQQRCTTPDSARRIVWPSGDCISVRLWQRGGLTLMMAERWCVDIGELQLWLQWHSHEGHDHTWNLIGPSWLSTFDTD